MKPVIGLLLGMAMVSVVAAQPAEQYVLGPLVPNQDVSLEWPDGSAIEVTLRVYEELPSFLPASVSPGPNATYSVTPWRSTPRQMTFTRPGYDDVVIEWRYDPNYSPPDTVDQQDVPDPTLPPEPPPQEGPDLTYVPDWCHTKIDMHEYSAPVSRTNAWQDGEPFKFTLRTVNNLPSFLPGTIDPGDGGTYHTGTWGDNPRRMYFWRPWAWPPTCFANDENGEGTIPVDCPPVETCLIEWGFDENACEEYDHHNPACNPPPYSNVFAHDLTFSSQQVYVGQPVEISVKVANQGNTASGPVDVYMVEMEFGEQPSFGHPVVSTQTLQSVPPNGVVEVTMYVSAGSPGMRYYGVCVENEDGAGSCTGNPYLPFQYEWQVGIIPCDEECQEIGDSESFVSNPDGYADVYPSHMEYGVNGTWHSGIEDTAERETYSGGVIIGDTINFKVTVRNKGDAASDTVTVQVVESLRHGVGPQPGDPVRSSAEVPPIAAGEAVVVILDVAVVETGLFYYGACVVSDDTTRDSCQGLVTVPFVVMQ